MDNSQFYTPLQKNAAYYRARAREVLKDSYKIALLVALLAAILGATTTEGFATGISIKLDNEDTKMIFSPQYFEYFSARFRYLIRNSVMNVLSAILFSIFVSSPVILGYRKFCLALNDRTVQACNVPTLFSFFTSELYWKSVQLNLFYSLILTTASLPAIAAAIVAACLALISPFMMLASVGILFLGALVTAVVSLPLSYTYAFAHTIMAEYPMLTPIEALRNSRNLMRGKRWKLFCLDFSFIGWILLSIPTCGIGLFFLIPYMQSARIAFYHDVANREAAKETEFPSLDPDDYKE